VQLRHDLSIPGLLVGRERDLAVCLITITEMNCHVMTKIEEVETCDDLVAVVFSTFNTKDGASSPGYPYINFASSYKAIREDTTVYDGVTLTEMVVYDSVLTILALIEAGPDLSALEYLQFGAACLNTPHVKGEPNKMKKLLAPRIVIAQSANCQIATTVLFDLVHPGIGHSLYCEGYGVTSDKLLAVRNYLIRSQDAYFPRKSPKLLKSDVSGWETSLSASSISWVMFAYSLVSTSKYNTTSLFALIGTLITEAAFLLDGGLVVVKNERGGQISGHYLTTKTNSPARGMFAINAGNIPVCMGDDTLELSMSDIEDLVSSYLSTGLTVRDAEVHSVDEFEFCSSLITYAQGIIHHAHANFGKSIYRLLTKGWSLAQATHLLTPGFSDSDSAAEFVAQMEVLNNALAAEGFESLADFDSAVWKRLYDADAFVLEDHPSFH